MPGFASISFDGLVGAGATAAFAAFARAPRSARLAVALESLPRGRPGARRVDFAAELGEGALEALALIVELRETLLDQARGPRRVRSWCWALVSFPSK